MIKWIKQLWRNYFPKKQKTIFVTGLQILTNARDVNNIEPGEYQLHKSAPCTFTARHFDKKGKVIPHLDYRLKATTAKSYNAWGKAIAQARE